MRTREPLPPPPRSNATGTKRRPHPSAPPPPGAHGDTERGEDAEIAPESSGSQHSTAQRGASPPPQPKAFRSGSQQLPPPQKKNPVRFWDGTTHGCDVAHSPRAALRIPGAEQRSALLSRISRRGKQILSSAFPPRPDPPAPQLCGHKGVPTAGEPCFVPMGPPGRRGEPGCAPRAAQLPLLAESSTKNQCASLIKPLHSRRALPSRPRAAKAALPPP